jgi:hypothetical protein
MHRVRKRPASPPSPCAHPEPHQLPPRVPPPILAVLPKLFPVAHARVSSLRSPPLYPPPGSPFIRSALSCYSEPFSLPRMRLYSFAIDNDYTPQRPSGTPSTTVKHNHTWYQGANLRRENLVICYCGSRFSRYFVLHLPLIGNAGRCRLCCHLPDFTSQCNLRPRYR